MDVSSSAGSARLTLQAAAADAIGVMLLSGCSLGGGEPSEKQMQRALQTKFEQVNSNLMDLAERCRKREFMSNSNPLQAFQCLQICVAAG